MYQPEEARLREFWTSLQGLWLKLYGSKMASIALINVSESSLHLTNQFYFVLALRDTVLPAAACSQCAVITV